MIDLEKDSAKHHKRTENIKAAFIAYRDAAEKGHAPAQRKLGLFYEKGKGVERDLEKAREWYTLAAHSGDAEAQFLLGRLMRHLGAISQTCTSPRR